LYGVERLIHALPQLFRLNKDWICVVADDGSEKKALQDFVDRHGLQGRVFFSGTVDHAQLKRLLNAADIFVLLSRYHNCTNTMWEAMASGKCIVTVDNETIREVLTSGENAVLLSQDTLAELAGILDELLKNDGLRSALANKARMRAGEVLESWDARIAKESKLIEALIEGRHEF
jgi:glycosyltransferase involved in cell wall biosynthesis